MFIIHTPTLREVIIVKILRIIIKFLWYFDKQFLHVCESHVTCMMNAAVDVYY